MPVADAMDAYPPLVRIARWKGGYWLGRSLSKEGLDSLLSSRFQFVTLNIVRRAWNEELHGRTVRFGIWGRKGRMLWLITFSPPQTHFPSVFKVHALESSSKDYEALASAWALLDLNRFLLPEGTELEEEAAEESGITPRGLPLSVVRGAASLDRLSPPIVEFDTEPYQLLGLDPWLMPVTEFAPWYLEMRQ